MRGDDREFFDRRDGRALFHKLVCEHRRARVPVGHQRDGHRRADRHQYDALDDADSHCMLARPAWCLANTVRYAMLGYTLVSTRLLRAGEQCAGARELQLE